MMVLWVTDSLIGTSDITQTLEVRHYGSRITVECHLFAVFCPERIAGHTQHQLVRGHLFHQSAGFYSLARVNWSHTCIFIGTEHTARHLSESTADQVVHIIRCFQQGRVSRHHIIGSRFTETLRDVHVVPVWQCRRTGPVCCVAVYFLSQFQ